MNKQHEKRLYQLEKSIRKKMVQIKNGSLKKEVSNIGTLINQMKTLDEALFEKLIQEYKEIIK